MMGAVDGLWWSREFSQGVIFRVRKVSERRCRRESDGIGSIQEERNRGRLPVPSTEANWEAFRFKKGRVG